MSVYPLQEHRLVGEQCIERCIVREGLSGPGVLVPASAAYPCYVRMCLCKILNPLHGFCPILAAVEIHLKERPPITNKMRMSIYQTRIHTLPVRIHHAVRGISFHHLIIASDGYDLTILNRNRLCNAEGAVNSIYLAVVQDEIDALFRMAGAQEQ